MWRYSLKVAFVALQAVWMLAVLPGHVRGMVVIGGEPRDVAPGAVPAKAVHPPACCDAENGRPGPAPATPTPSSERKSRCAVCYQAHGYTLPPVFDIDLAPAGLCELRRSIEPSRRHRLPCRPTYFANGPPHRPSAASDLV